MHRPLLLLAAMVVLAALDIVGALFAKQFADRHRPLEFALGAGVFLVLFVVYAVSLRLGDLSMVTLGWIVIVQVGLLLLDQLLYGLHLQGRQWAAVAAIIALQVYLMLTVAPGDTPAVQSAAEVGIPAPRTPSGEPATPVLTLDLEVVADRYAQLSDALPGVALHYAAKANPAPEVLQLLADRGASFDVASPAEILACLAAGAGPGDLSYGNTVKKERDIAFAHQRGVRLFTFDDRAELDKLVRAAPGATLCCRLATSGAGADWSLSGKFGCAPDTALGLLTRASAAGHPVGLAFHVGSQQRDPAQWDAPLRTAGQLQAALAAAGVRLDVVNIGGGFPGSYREPTPAIGAYGEAITAGLRTHLAEPLPRLLAEPGRFLVADAGVITAEVVLVAERGGQRWVYVDIGLFGGLAEAMDEAIAYRIETTRDGGPVGPVVLAGPTCDSVDVLYRSGCALPLALTAGDRIRLLSTGAYTASYASVGFNGLSPLSVRCGRAPTRV